MNCPRCRATMIDGLCPSCLLEEGPKIGGLELIEEIGRGGMGSVWRARHTRLGRPAAVKFLPAELRDDPEFRTRFEREARTMAMLNHPNIVGVHDFGEQEGRGYLVMEFVDGRPLSKLIPQPVEAAVDIARQVCDALAYAHARGVVHRDVKPENILVTADGHVKVADFGIARLVRSDGLTRTDVAVGTPSYMSPEAIDAAAPDPRMDIYSLGVVLYETIKGARPVGSFDPLPGGLDRVVRRALAPRAEDRFASAAEFRDALKAATAQGSRLPPEEGTWIYAVAMLQSISTAVAIWAVLECITPKKMALDYTPLLIDLGMENRGDHIYSRARFELWPTIAALATFAVAITTYGFLRRHWRLAGIEEEAPDRRVPEARIVLFGGIGACAVYAVRLLMEAAGQAWVRTYIPPFGAMILVAILFFFWTAVLNCWRIHRPLSREPAMWLGFGLALVPPVVELLT